MVMVSRTRAGLGASFLLLLAGCVDPQQQWAMDYQHCESFGFRAGTDPFAHCMMNLAQQRNAQDAEYQQIWEISNAIAGQNQIDQFSAAAPVGMDGMPPPPSPPGFPNLPRPGFDGMPGIPSVPGMTCTRHTTANGNTGTTTENCRG